MFKKLFLGLILSLLVIQPTRAFIDPVTVAFIGVGSLVSVFIATAFKGLQEKCKERHITLFCCSQVFMPLVPGYVRNDIASFNINLDQSYGFQCRKYNPYTGHDDITVFDCKNGDNEDVINAVEEWAKS